MMSIRVSRSGGIFPHRFINLLAADKLIRLYGGLMYA